MASDRKVRALIPPKVAEGLRRAVGALRGAGVEFALVGGLALDHYADEPRFTRDVDLVVTADRWREAVRAIRDAGFTRGRVDKMLTQLEDRDGVRVDLLFGVGDPEESAHATAKVRSVLGVPTPVAAPAPDAAPVASEMETAWATPAPCAVAIEKLPPPMPDAVADPTATPTALRMVLLRPVATPTPPAVPTAAAGRV